MQFRLAISTFLSFIVVICQVSSSALPKSVTRFRRGADVAAGGHDWGYDEENGPATWCSKYAACCGLLQSPINLVGDNSTHVHFSPLNLHNYNIPRKIIVQNNGHTVVVSLKNPQLAPTISGAHLPGTYKLVAIHFHWGDNSSEGSEHYRDGEPFPLEIHFVHYNTKYSDSTAAQQHSDGLAVLGVFHTIHTRNNSHLQPIVNELKHIQFAEQSAEVPRAVVLRNLLPDDVSKFFRYSGSLTTPPCDEAVTWTILDATKGVSEAQLDEFRRDLHAEHEHEIESEESAESNDLIHTNHRDVQDGHDRLVQHNVDRWRSHHRHFSSNFRIRGHRHNG